MIMEQTIYTVHAFRWGNHEKHSYPVGVFDSLKKARESAEHEVKDRGGKYNCEIYQFKINIGRTDNFQCIYEVCA